MDDFHPDSLVGAVEPIDGGTMTLVHLAGPSPISQIVAPRSDSGRNFIRAHGLRKEGAQN
jgi:hypothetical protein